MRLLIDDRERKIIPFFKINKTHVEIEVTRIYAGDYALYDEDDLIFIIERKNIKDLAASITDGRKANISNLLEARIETGCKLVYLIEGKARYKPDHKIGRIPYKNLQAHLDHIAIRDNIIIIYSSNYEDSANRILEFIKNYSTLNILKTKQGGDFNIQKKKSTPDDTIACKIWTCIPGITDNNVSLFYENYHISDLILEQIPYDEIYAMKYSSGTIIGKRADKILSVCKPTIESKKIYCNMLSTINGLTKKTAEIILLQYDFHEILRGNISVDQIKSVQKTEKSKVGAKIATEILRFFVKKNNKR